MENKIYYQGDKGAAALAKGDFETASQVFDRGLAILGEAYDYEDLIDDSGMKLALAQAEEKRDKVELSANLKKAVLTSRLESLRKKHRCE